MGFAALKLIITGATTKTPLITVVDQVGFSGVPEALRRYDADPL
jgi:hypothetical protein